MAEGCDSILSLSEWIKHDGKGCRPCMLPLLSQWYESELKESGRQDLAGRIKKERLKKEVSPQDVAGVLDFVKTQVQGGLLDRLRELDCSAQLNEPEEQKEVEREWVRSRRATEA